MSESIPLINAAPAVLKKSDLEAILAEARSSSYIQEVTSGEEPPEESGLWDTIAILPDSLYEGAQGPKDVDTEDEAVREGIAEHIKSTFASERTKEGRTWSPAAIVLADDRTKKDGSLLVVSIDLTAKAQKGKIAKDALRVVPKSLVEICCNLAIANMSLEEYRNMAGGAEVFDSGH